MAMMMIMVVVVVVMMMMVMVIVMVVVVVVMVLENMTSYDQLYHLIVNHTLLCIGILDRWVVISHKVALKGNAIRKNFFCHNSTVAGRGGRCLLFLNDAMF